MTNESPESVDQRASVDSTSTAQFTTSRPILGNVDLVESLPTPRGTATPVHENTVRKWLAFALLILLALIVILGFVFLALSKILGIEVTDLTGMLQLFFTSVLTLVSTVLGFYFGAERHRKRDEGE
jgi:hypothetical protein